MAEHVATSDLGIVADADNELWLFTAEFPFGSGESFLENELPTLAKRFARVRIFPMHRVEGVRELPPGIVLEELFDDPYRPANAAMLWKYRREVSLLLKSLFKDLGLLLLKGQWQRELRSRIRQLAFRLSVVERDLLPRYQVDRTVLYSYWTHDWATILGLLRVRHPQVAFISRAHGFDLYEHQHHPQVIPFRDFQLKQIDRMFCVSQAGLDHMRTRHPIHVAKYGLARLGTRDHGVAQPSYSGPLCIASCALLIPRKRLELIVKALALTHTPVHWTHFGDGPELKRIRALVSTLPPHVQVDLKGSVANSAIMQWYATHPVDVFVHTSKLEGGVAVALQEASSFGIPLIAADSGGVRDIVTLATGILLPTDMDPAELASIVDGFRSSPMATAEFRSGVRAFWEQNFQAEVSYARFCDRLIELHQARQPHLT